jgi:hypothetical protein
LEAVQVSLKAAERRFARIKALSDRGAVSSQQFADAESEVDRLKAQKRIRLAELGEPTVRLRQAERRLAALRKAPQSEDLATRSSPQERLLRLERDLKKLLDQVRALERERNRTPPRD